MAQTQSFKEFYAYYLAAHSNRWNRRLHLFAYLVGAALAAACVAAGWPLLAIISVPVGLGIALLGHRFIEKNDSVVFDRPIWTALADLRMFKDMLLGKLAF
jgi:hypothetical protein